MNKDSVNLHLALRIALVAFFAVVIQEAAVSQISIFGVTADVTPLVVMSIGLLAGSLPGAIAGFAIGLFVESCCSRRSASPRCCSSRSATGPGACVSCATRRTA